MKRTFLYLIAASLFALALAACSTTTVQQTASSVSTIKTDKGEYTNITVTDLQSMLKQKDFTLVNVHVPYQGHIAGTDKFLAYDTITSHLDQLPDKNAKIVLYCRSGNMSTIAATTLADLGYTHLYQLEGGFNAWKAAGLPLETTQQ